MEQLAEHYSAQCITYTIFIFYQTGSFHEQSNLRQLDQCERRQ